MYDIDIIHVAGIEPALLHCFAPGVYRRREEDAGKLGQFGAYAEPLFQSC